jgi:hypothetical protein
MYRKQIILDSVSDATTILVRLGADCTAAGLSCQDTSAIISELREPLEALIQSGTAVASFGGQFRADRQVETDAARITLIAHYGMRPGLFARLWKWFSEKR